MQTLSEETWGSAPILCLACNINLAKQINLHSLINRTTYLSNCTRSYYLNPFEYNRLEINRDVDIKDLYRNLQDLCVMWNYQKDFHKFEGDNRLFIFGKYQTRSTLSYIYCLGIRVLLVNNKLQEPSSIELARAMDSMDQLVPLADINTNNFDLSFLHNRN